MYPVWEKPGSSNSRCLTLGPERCEGCMLPAEPRTRQLLVARGPDVQFRFKGIAFTNHILGSGFPNEHHTLLQGSVSDQHCHTDSAISQVTFKLLFGNDLWSQSMCYVRNSALKMLLTRCLASYFCWVFSPASMLFARLDTMWSSPKIKATHRIKDLPHVR